jgi:rubrerythrin
MADYHVDIIPKKDMTYQDLLTIAMKKEKGAFKLYTDLANKIIDQNIKEIFLGLAQEEAKHKLRFEIEYDEYILKDN